MLVSYVRIASCVLLSLAVFFVFPLSLAVAAEAFVSPTGSAQGDGTMTRPWSLFETLKNPPTAIRPGDTVYLLPGTYVAPDRGYFFSRLAGEANSYITVRPHNGGRATIVGGIQVERGWVMFRDIEITNTDTRRRSSQTGSFPTDVSTVHGFNVYAPNVKIVNNIVHDNASGLSAWIRAPDTELSGNIVYYNGWQASDRGHGHGIYAQNDTGSKRIVDNIIFSQFARGLQFYGSESAALRNLYLTGNILFSNGALSTSGGDRNVLIGGGRVAESPVVNNNYTYSDPTGISGDVNIGYWPFGVGCSNLQLNNNYFVSGGRGLILHECAISSMTGNTVVAETMGFDPSQYPNNTYISPTTVPRGVKAFVRRNQHESGRANIVIYNWDRSPVVEVDVSNVGLTVGDQYELRNVQDYFGDRITGVYSGRPIAISMTGRTVAKPVGWAAPASTFPGFGVFVLRRVGQGVIPTDTQPPDVTLLSPNNGSIIEGTVQLTAAATDNIKVLGVSFQVDGRQIGNEDVSAPYTAMLDTSTLVAGNHRVVATARDAAGNQGASQPATVTVNTTSDSPSDPSNSGGAGLPPGDTHSILTEAEAGRRANSLVAHDPNALGGRYVYAPSSNTGMVEFRVRVPSDGGYALWIRTLMPDAARDSLRVTVDGVPAAALPGSDTWSPQWGWIRLKGDSVPRTLNLKAGLRIIVFSFPEGGVKLDAFLLTTDIGFVPDNGQATPLPEEDPNSAVQTPTNSDLPPVRSAGSPSAELGSDTTQVKLRLNTDEPAICRYSRSPGIPYSSATSMFSQTGTTTHETLITGLEAGNIYAYYSKCADLAGNSNVDDYLIRFSIAHRAISTAAPPVLVYVEAESGSRRSMVILATQAAFGGRYVYAREDRVGSVAYRVRVPTAGTYAVWGRVFSPDQSRDSLAISVNGGPTVEYDTAQSSWTNTWRWSRALTSVTLSEGYNEITFFAREPNTLLDGFILVNDGGFIPTDSSVRD